MTSDGPGFPSAAIGLNHNHVYGQTEAMLVVGCRLVAYHAPEDDLAQRYGDRSRRRAASATSARSWRTPASSSSAPASPPSGRRWRCAPCATPRACKSWKRRRPPRGDGCTRVEGTRVPVRPVRVGPAPKPAIETTARPPSPDRRAVGRRSRTVAERRHSWLPRGISRQPPGVLADGAAPRQGAAEALAPRPSVGTRQGRCQGIMPRPRTQATYRSGQAATGRPPVKRRPKPCSPSRKTWSSAGTLFARSAR